jgi:hypothetical protein
MTHTPSATHTPTFTVTPTFSSSPTPTETFTASPSPTPIAPFHFSLAVFNSAGERVRLIDGLVPAWQAPQGLEMKLGVFCPDDGGKASAWVNGSNYGFSWDGANDSGALVASGAYLLVLEARDSFGHGSTFTAPATVLRVPSQLSIEIFNSAGERVRSLRAPAGAVLESLSLSGAAADASSGLKIRFGAAPSASVLWDGRNDAGLPATSGVYTVQVTQQRKGQALETRMATVQWLAQPLGSALVTAWPNPVSASERELRLSIQGVPGSRAWGNVYNLAGDKVAELAPVALPQPLIWRLQGSSAGIYLARVSYETPSGALQNKVCKIGVFR